MSDNSRVNVAAFTFSTAWLQLIIVWCSLAAPLMAQFADERVDPPLPPPAQQEPGLTLADVESLAVSQHPAILEALANLDAARGRWLQVGL